VKRGGIKVRPVRPNERLDFWIKPNPIKDGQIPQRTKKLPGENGPEVDRLLGTVVKFDAQRKRSFDHERLHAINGVAHYKTLDKRINREWRLAGLKSLPIRHELLLVQFGPGFDETPLSTWQGSGDQLDGFQAENGNGILIVGMKMRQVVWCANLHVHSNNDPEETTQFRHYSDSITRDEDTGPMGLKLA
jgi:hypothetical protein